ncbi:nitrilase family protein [Niabella aquatica]
MKDQLTITLIQTQLFWEDKPANLQMLEDKISSISQRTEVIVLPEMFSTGFTMNAKGMAETMDGPSVEWMKKIAAQKKVVLTGSLIIKEQDEEGVDAYFNRLIWMLPNGRYGIYDKRHLFDYACEGDHYTAGEKRLIASVNDWKINLQVCYDLRFPVWARQTPPHHLERGTGSEIGYDVLMYVANWPERRSHAWKTLLQARAIENQCYVIGVNRVGNDGNTIYHSGDSMVIDPLGEVLYHKKDEEDIYTITLDKRHLNTVREQFPFLKDADDFKIF